MGKRVFGSDAYALIPCDERTTSDLKQESVSQ